MKSLNLPIFGLVSVFFNLIFKDFSTWVVFQHQVVNPLGLSRHVVSIVGGHLFSSLDCFPSHTDHFLVVFALVVDDLTVPVVRVVGAFGAIIEVNEDISIGVVESSMENLGQFFLVLHLLKLLPGVDDVGPVVIANERLGFALPAPVD